MLLNEGAVAGAAAFAGEYALQFMGFSDGFFSISEYFTIYLSSPI